jgi:hypothetical protein
MVFILRLIISYLGVTYSYLRAPTPASTSGLSMAALLQYQYSTFTTSNAVPPIPPTDGGPLATWRMVKSHGPGGGAGNSLPT